MHAEQKRIADHGAKLFSARASLLTLWQEEAEQFYVERADFTQTRNIGQEFADHLMTSYPVMVRRDLGNALSAMLRDRSQEWFHMSAGEERDQAPGVAEWLQEKSGLQRRAMYDVASGFIRAAKEADHDFVTFGQCAISTEFSMRHMRLLYRCWHLRDMAWADDESGNVSERFRRWKPTMRDLVRMFPDRVAETVKKSETTDPWGTVNCMHIVVPMDMYDGPLDHRRRDLPWVSLYLDMDNNYCMEAVGQWTPIYTIPRWQTVSGSQYAYSPASVIGLPDARLLQAMTRALLVAGEKAADPPMLAVQEALRSDIGLYPGAVTWIDAQYDERLGEVLRPISQDRHGLPFAADMAERLKETMAEAFYTNKLGLPPADREMTAFETGQRVKEYIRSALPLFEPMEVEYNGQVCEQSFELLRRNGLFGAPDEMPEALYGADVSFKFESPLHEAVERKQGQAFAEMAEMLAIATEMDRDAPAQVDVIEAFRSAVKGIGTPANWINDPTIAKAINDNRRQQEEAQQMLSMVGEGAAVAEAAGRARQAFASEAA